MPKTRLKKRTGRPRLSAAELAARGSWLAQKRATEESAKGRAKRKKTTSPAAEFRPLTRRALDRLILLLPGYDPHRDAAGCWFEYRIANKAIAFFETQLRHVEGAMAGKPFHLEDCQRAIVANLFGWQRIDDHGRTVRRYREAFLYLPRKNGKTPLAAGLCLFTLFEDGEAGAQIVSAAAEREQAALLFRHARGMVDQSPELAERATIFGGIGQRAIQLRDDPASSYKVISADAGSKHGFNLHLAIVDELHAQPNRDLVDTLQTAMASANRAQPLLIFITTADFSRQSICNEKLDYACKVRDGIIEDANFLPVVYETDPVQNWTSPEVWAAANPLLDVSVSRDYLERECKRAQETPTYENTFKRLHLNMKTEQDVRWLPMDRWDANGVPDALAWRSETIEALDGRTCFGGLDLSTTIDVTALTLAFQDGARTILLPFFWIPAANAEKRERRDRVPYITWARQGFIKMTAGDVVDYDVVRADINEIAKHFKIKQIAADRWNAAQILTQLAGDGFDVVQFGQGFASMSSPSKELEKLVIGGSLEHGSNPVLRWMASNAAAETDAAGNIKPSKKKSTERIDGIVAAVMAIGVAAVQPVKPASIYETRGVLQIDDRDLAATPSRSNWREI